MKLVRKLSSVLLLTIPLTCFANDELVLNKLSDCRGLARIHSLLLSPLPAQCRSAHDDIEQRLFAQYFATRSIRACLLSLPPTQTLADFSCIETASPGGSEIACVRKLDGALVSHFKSSYENSYRSKALAYQEAADLCPIGGKDSTPATSELFPSALNAIGSPIFGFVLNIGKEATPRSRAYHGFAKLDPKLASRKSDALEVFDMFDLDASAPAGYASSRVLHAGLVDIEVDDAKKEADDYANLLRSASHLPVAVQFRVFTLKYTGTQNPAFAERQDNLDDWQAGIASILRHAGFRKLNGTEIAGSPFANTESIRDTLLEHMQFGTRERMRGQIGERIDFLMRGDDDADCGQSAVVFTANPVKGVKEDFGSIATMIIGIGCSATANRQEFKSLSERFDNYLTDKGKLQ